MLTKRPLVFAHGGASTHYPENTLRAFSEAFDEGADGAEVGARETRDHALVVINDETVDRTADGHGLVAEMTLAERSCSGLGVSRECLLSRKCLTSEILRLAEIGVDALTPNDPLSALSALEIGEIGA